MTSLGHLDMGNKEYICNTMTVKLTIIISIGQFHRNADGPIAYFSRSSSRDKLVVKFSYSGDINGK